jgi:hypothetical protein
MTPDCNLLYMITPLKKSFNDYHNEKNDVQKELDEIKISAYQNFIYFPFNIKLLSIIDTISSGYYS